MAYRLRTDESVAHGLKRVVMKELSAAVDTLSIPTASDEDIHEVRKSIKKVRAVLQLVENEIDVSDALDDLRTAGHLLAPLRDADALVGNAKALCARHGRPLSAKACVALSRRLSEKRTRLRGAADRVKKRAAQSLADTWRSADGWNWDKIGQSDFQERLRRQYKRARRGMLKSRDSNQAERFHTWRKRIKTLWYGMRLLQSHVGLGRQLTDLKRLESWLGEDHNLAVLRRHIVRTDGAAGASQLRGLVEQRQKGLRRKALALAARRFSETPKRFSRRVQRTSRKR
jgi:CHAD domain-containing protein